MIYADRPLPGVAAEVLPGAELYARALDLGWTPTELVSAWPHGQERLWGVLVSRERLELVERHHADPEAPGDRRVIARGELDVPVREAEGPAGRAWCPCCAYRGDCDGCLAARRLARAEGRDAGPRPWGTVTLCLCAGRGPGDGHAPGCPDADQPWGPPYLMPEYAEAVEWRRVDDARQAKGWRWEKTVRQRVTGYRRVEADDAVPELASGGREEPAAPAPETVVAILDTETTGLPNRPKGFVPRIVEIAVAVVSFPSGRVLGFRSTLVDPETSIPAEATRAHGIGDAEVAGAPTWGEVWPRVRRFVEGFEPAAVVAHNASFDRARIEDDCRRTGLDAPGWPWVCSLALAKAHLPGRSSYALQALRESLGLSAGEAHRAAGDVATCASLVARLAAGKSWEELVGPLRAKGRAA